METPDEMLERLDRMGAERVHALLGKGHFEPRTVPLVRGWLDRQERERETNGGDRTALPNLYAALEKARDTAEEAREAATKVATDAANALRLAKVAVAVGCISGTVALLVLFALAIR